MKKVMAVLLALVLILSFGACGADHGGDAENIDDAGIGSDVDNNIEILIEMTDAFTTRVFTENADGSQAELRVFAGAAEKADLDNDGFSEIICYENANNSRNVVIIDEIDGEITEADVNTHFGCRASDYAGNIGNIESEYQNCITVMTDGESGKMLTELYDYKDGEFVYRCGLDDAMRK